MDYSELHALVLARILMYNFKSVRRDFILPVNKERREMVGNIILYFSTLASAFRLKAPLPPYLPPAEESRERLVRLHLSLEITSRCHTSFYRSTQSENSI